MFVHIIIKLPQTTFIYFEGVLTTCNKRPQRMRRHASPDVFSYKVINKWTLFDLKFQENKKCHILYTYSLTIPYHCCDNEQPTNIETFSYSFTHIKSQWKTNCILLRCYRKKAFSFSLITKNKNMSMNK